MEPLAEQPLPGVVDAPRVRLRRRGVRPGVQNDQGSAAGARFGDRRREHPPTGFAAVDPGDHGTVTRVGLVPAVPADDDGVAAGVRPERGGDGAGERAGHLPCPAEPTTSSDAAREAPIRAWAARSGSSRVTRPHALRGSEFPRGPQRPPPPGPQRVDHFLGWRHDAAGEQRGDIEGVHDLQGRGPQAGGPRGPPDGVQ